MTRVNGCAGARQRGFTLVEIAVVIAIIAALLGTLLVPLATQVEASRVKSTDAEMREVREALIGFAMSNGRLPCPDNDRDGLEDGAAGVCAAAPAGIFAALAGGTAGGYLPYSTLGSGATDAWGRLFLYQVTVEFTAAAVAGAVAGAGVPNGRLDLEDRGNLMVNTRGDDPNIAGAATRDLLRVADNVPAVIVSVGANGWGGITPAGQAVADPDVVVDETRDERNNRTGAGTFMTRTRTVENPGCDDAVEASPFCAFDDRVVWVSSPLLFNRLVTASVLP